MSDLKFKSFLQKGIVKISLFSTIHRLSNIFNASSLLYFLPIRLFIYSKSKGISTTFCFSLYISEKAVIFIHSIFFSSSDAIKLTHLIAISGNISFSNTFRESVLTHNLLPVFLIIAWSK
jgi:hypothetical protein